MVPKNPAVAMLDMDPYVTLRHQTLDGIRSERASTFPNSHRIFATKANNQRVPNTRG
jgi:hypothetical protein